MPSLKVQSGAQSVAMPDQVWAVLRDFCALWHPAIDTMHAERTEAGGLVRHFTVKGEDTVYRERLTYFSDCDRAMAYSHVAGIADVQSYDARLTVTPSSAGSTITMNAELTAPTPRAEEIAAGTQVVFDMGTQAIAELALDEAGIPNKAVSPPQMTLTHDQIDNCPQLAFTHGGKDSDTLCLFVHGIGGNRTNWTEQLRAMAPYARVAALDLRGYGDSTLGPMQSSIDDYCADIFHVTQHFGAQKLILCGLSYGAWIATSFAMRHPEKLAALVLSGGCTGMSEAGADERNAFRLSRETPMNEGQTPADFAPAVVEVIAGPDASTTARATLLASMESIPTATYADALRCFTNPLDTFDFAKLTMPVLLMTGEHDRLAPPAEIKSVADRIWDASPHPDVRFEVIAGAGHVCNVEKPNAYNAVLVDFIKRVLP
jgi:pimeloyl-ACP methyl ester carboxylesterase